MRHPFAPFAVGKSCLAAIANPQQIEWPRVVSGMEVMRNPAVQTPCTAHHITEAMTSGFMRDGWSDLSVHHSHYLLAEAGRGGFSIVRDLTGGTDCTA